MAVIVLKVTPTIIRRLTATLFIAQSLSSLGATAALAVGAIAATRLTGSSALAGVPTTLYLLGIALGAYPTGRLMDRYGRRLGLWLGFAVGLVGALAGAFSLIAWNGILLFVANALMGLSRGALDQGRFAAADLATPANRAQTVGWVVLGGAVGGMGGPLVIGPAGHLAVEIGFPILTGPYMAAAGLFLGGMLMIAALLRPDPRDIARRLLATESVGGETGDRPLLDPHVPARTLRQALAVPAVRVAMVAMVLAQVVMTAVMVITPVQMTEHLHHTLDDVALVVAAHVTGMYASSLMTGRIADRFGHARTIVIGAALLAVACLLAPFALEMLRLAMALFILGMGWNFCFVAGSALLTDSLQPNERGRIQGANDLLVGLVSATGSLMSGLAFATIGYTGIALTGISLALLLVLFTRWMTWRGSTVEY